MKDNGEHFCVCLGRVWSRREVRGGDKQEHFLGGDGILPHNSRHFRWQNRFLTFLHVLTRQRNFDDSSSKLLTLVNAVENVT